MSGRRLLCISVIAVFLGVLSACSTGNKQVEASTERMDLPTVSTMAEELSSEMLSEQVETMEGRETGTVSEEPTVGEATQPRRPVGHQIVYSDGEIYGWTRYEYDETGCKDMIVFIAPNGNEYWSPVFYDGNGHVIPENVGTYSVMDENGLHLEVGTEDSRGRRTPMVTYAYDAKGNLTDYWYMYVNGKYLRHVVYTYDSHDHMIREELYASSKERLESYTEYIYNGQCQLIRKNEVEGARKDGSIVYTLYQYDEMGRLSREEKVWGGRTHDYVDYFYNDNGELAKEYHFLEDKMMGGLYTVEYLFEVIDDSAG